jgi:predicted MFS family arabinose efflux permease
VTATAATGTTRRSIAALLIGTFCSSAAAIAQATVLGKLVYDLTNRALDLGWLGLAEFAPAALLVLVTGSVADRVERRRVTAVAALGEAAVAAALAMYAAGQHTSVGPIFLMVICFGIARAFAAPALRALPADIVPPERLPWLVARFSGTWQAALVFGPVLGGFLYTVDVWVPFVAVVVLLVMAAVSFLFVQPLPAHEPEPAADVYVAVPAAEMAAMEAGVEPVLGHAEAAAPAEGGWHEAVEGLRFIRRRPVLLGAISLDLFAVLFGGAVALLPAIAEDRLGVGAVGLGWLRAAGGLGAAAVTAALAVRPVTRMVGRRLLAVVALFGVFTIVLGITHSYAVAFVSLFVLSGADAVSVFIRATLVPLATPASKRGRVLAVENVFIGASNELGAFESGVAAQLLGTGAAVVLGGAGTLAVAALWWRWFPALRDIDRFPSGTPEDD